MIVQTPILRDIDAPLEGCEYSFDSISPTVLDAGFYFFSPEAFPAAEMMYLEVKVQSNCKPEFYLRNHGTSKLEAIGKDIEFKLYPTIYIMYTSIMAHPLLWTAKSLYLYIPPCHDDTYVTRASITVYRTAQETENRCEKNKKFSPIRYSPTNPSVERWNPKLQAMLQEI